MVIELSCYCHKFTNLFFGVNPGSAELRVSQPTLRGLLAEGLADLSRDSVPQLVRVPMGDVQILLGGFLDAMVNGLAIAAGVVAGP